jgi:hypothetical protein
MRKHPTFQVGPTIVSLVPQRNVHRVHELARARMLVHAFAAERGMASVRRWVEESRALAFVHSDAAILEIAAELLANGLHVAVEEGQVARFYDDPEEAIPISDLIPKDPDVIKERDWIAIRIVDSWGEAVADEPYTLRFSDGEEVDGQTNAEGVARYDGIPRGSCRISLMRATANEWGPLLGAGVDPKPDVPLQPATPTLEPDGDRDSRDTACSLVAPPDEPSPPGTTWLVLEVQDAWGLPISDEPCEVRLPSGETMVMNLDGVGRIEVTGIEGDGPCTFTFQGVAAEASGWYTTGIGHIVRVEAMRDSAEEDFA